MRSLRSLCGFLTEVCIIVNTLIERIRVLNVVEGFKSVRSKVLQIIKANEGRGV